MKVNLKIVVLCTLMILFFGTNALTKQVSNSETGIGGNWELLGATEVKHTSDHDAIILVGPYHHFRKLKFKVSNANLVLHRLIIRYDDGGLAETLEGHYKIPAGGESKALSLKGAKRNLKTVEFWYDTKELLKDKAEVSLYGMK